jgi:hypothetical protein
MHTAATARGDPAHGLAKIAAEILRRLAMVMQKNHAPKGANASLNVTETSTRRQLRRSIYRRIRLAPCFSVSNHKELSSACRQVK